jgi:iron(III) transport system substrate-binding protein
LQAEKSNSQASVFHGGSTDNFIQAIGQGLLEKYTSPEAKNLPAEYLDKQGYWTPFYIGAICFACNKDWFTKNKLKYPESWADLLKPEFKGQVSMAHPSTSGTSYTILATLVQLMGEEPAITYLKSLNSNVRQYVKSGTAPPNEVALGEAAIGIAFSHDALKPAGEGYPVELSFPKDGTGYEIGGLGIIAGGPEKEKANAKRLIDWSISKAGQELFDTAKSYRVPLNKTATPPKGAIKIADLKTITYDAQWAGTNRTRSYSR